VNTCVYRGVAVTATILALSAQTVGAQATNSDAFSTALSCCGDSGFGFDHKYRWDALEKGAEEAAKNGYLGKAECLFESARQEAHADLSDCKERRMTMEAITETEKGRFYQRQLNAPVKAKSSYEAALKFFRGEFAKQRLSTIYRPSRELVNNLDRALVFYADLLSDMKLSTAAEAALDESEQARATLSTPLKSAGKGDIDFGPYMARLQERVQWFWAPPFEKKSSRSVVNFKILRDGTVVAIRSESGESVAANAAGMKAIEAASPFDPLPTGAADDVDIQFTFDQNVGRFVVNSRGVRTWKRN
jgi:membrane protein involved in colicin uptake